MIFTRATDFSSKAYRNQIFSAVLAKAKPQPGKEKRTEGIEVHNDREKEYVHFKIKFTYTKRIVLFHSSWKVPRRFTGHLITMFYFHFCVYQNVVLRLELLCLRGLKK